MYDKITADGISNHVANAIEGFLYNVDDQVKWLAAQIGYGINMQGEEFMNDLWDDRAIGLLKAIAKKLNYTDAEMADALGMDGKNAADRFRKIKTGKSNISDQVLLKASRIAIDNEIMEFDVEYRLPKPIEKLNFKLTETGLGRIDD